MTALTPGTWQLDPAHTDVNFSVRHAGISKVRGTFNALQGKVAVGDDFKASKVDISVDLASVNTRDENRDGHLKSADFFDTEKFPTMTFSSTEVRAVGEEPTEFVLVGDLTIKGVTQPIELNAEFGGQVVDAFGATRAGFEATGEISRKEFDLTWNAALETGGVLVGDKVKIEVDASFVLPEENEASQS